MNHLIHMRTFLDAYRSGSLTKAAVRLGITQPAASAHIQALETFVGKPLFVRQARGLSPTPAADDLARSIAPHLDGLEAKVATVRARSTELAGTVYVACPADYLAAGLAGAVPPLLDRGIGIRFQLGDKERIYSLLDEGAVDLAITAYHPGGKQRGFHSPQSACQEPAATRHSFDRAKWMLDRAAPDPHQAWIVIYAGFHPIESRLIEQAVDRALSAGSALRFDGAYLAGACPITDRSIARVLARRSEGFARWATDGVADFVVDKLSGAEVLAVHSTTLDRR